MQNAMYSIIAFIAVIMHLIIYSGTKRINPAVHNEDKSYSNFQIAVLLYYLIDASWGIAAELKSGTVLHIQSMLCFVGMTFAVIMWNRFVISYLDEHGKAKVCYNVIGAIFCLFTGITLIVNFFEPVIFSIDASCNYHAGPLRVVFWIMQILLFVAAALRTGVVARRFTGAKKQRFVMVFLFCIIMIGANIVQALYPLFPTISIGYILGNVVLYIYVFEDEKSVNMQMQYGVIDAICRGIDDVFLADFNKNSVVAFKLHGKLIPEAERKNREYDTTWKYYIDKYVHEDERALVAAMCDADVVRDRLRDNETYSVSYRVNVNNEEHYYQVKFSSVEDFNDKTELVIMAYECIDDLVQAEKKRKEELSHLTESAYKDEMTGLLNRRSFDERMQELDEEKRLDNIAIVALDINGLKDVNDELGHDAGDELICGAASVISDTYLPYGEVYRIGGDEFAAIINNSAAYGIDFKKILQKTMDSWKGNLVERISISQGIVYGRDYKGENIRFLLSTADKIMYGEKAEHYNRVGLDRRMQNEAFEAICNNFEKILKIDVTNDIHQIIDVNEDERDALKGYSDSISGWFKGFANSGQVHIDDTEEFLRRTDLTYIRDYFRNNKESLCIFYRRLIGKRYARVMMEIVKARDYTDEEQKLFLFVKNIDL